MSVAHENCGLKLKAEEEKIKISIARSVSQKSGKSAISLHVDGVHNQQ